MLASSLKKLRSQVFCGFLTLGLSGAGCTVYSDGLLTPSDGGGGDGTAGASADLGGAGLIDSGGGGSSAGVGSGDIAGNGNVGGGESHGGGAGALQGGTGGAAAGGGAGKGGAAAGGAAAGGAAAGGAGKGGASGTAGSVGHAGASGAGANGGNGGNGGHAGAAAGGAPAGGAPAGGASAGGASAGGAPAGGAGGAGGVLCSDHPISPTSSWVASASHHQSTSPVTNLTDGTTARWSTGKPQAGDEWLQMDFGATVNLRTINLQQGPTDGNDYPRSYAVIVSNTALDMNGIVRASGVGTAGVTTTIVLPNVTSGRYLLIKQLGTSLSWWSVEELEASCSD